MTRPNESHPKDALPAYLAGDLSAEEQRRVEAHLETCSECVEELHRLDEAYVALVESLPAEAPPVRAWDRIERRIVASRGTTNDHREVGRESRSIVQDEPRSPVGSPTTDRPPPTRQPYRAPVWQTLAVAASLLVATVGVLWGVDRQQAYQQAAAQQAEITRWLSQPGVTARALPIEDTLYGGSVLLRDDGRALVVMREPAPAGRSYQAWGIAGDTPRSLGVIDDRALEVSAEGFDVIAVSLEPEGGSPAPTEVLGGVPAS